MTTFTPLMGVLCLHTAPYLLKKRYYGVLFRDIYSMKVFQLGELFGDIMYHTLISPHFLVGTRYVSKDDSKNKVFPKIRTQF